MDHQVDGWLAMPAHVTSWVMLRTGVLGTLMRYYGKDRKRMESSVRAIVRSREQRTPKLLDAIMVAAERGECFAAFEQWQRDQFLWNRLKTNYADRLAAFSVPVLIVHGDHDSGVPVARAEEAARLIQAASLVVVPDAGHWVQRDRPEIVLPAVIDFLDGLNSPRCLDR